MTNAPSEPRYDCPMTLPPWRAAAGNLLPGSLGWDNIRRMESTRSSLLRRVRDQADSASWDEFVGLYRPILIKYVGSRGLAAHDVDDVVQVIFEKLWQQLPNFELQRQRGRFRTWLWRVMHNAVVDWLPAQQRRVAAEETRRQELIARQSQFAQPHELGEMGHSHAGAL